MNTIFPVMPRFPMNTISAAIAWDGDRGAAFSTDFGWKPGAWPEAFFSSAPDGNTRRFCRDTEISSGEELAGFNYRSGSFAVAVFNE